MQLLYLCRPPAVFNYDPSKLPEDWLPMNTETPEWTDLVPVSTHCPAFQRVSDSFHETLPKIEYKVLKIYRVQNIHLWHKYHKYDSAVVAFLLVRLLCNAWAAAPSPWKQSLYQGPADCKKAMVVNMVITVWTVVHTVLTATSQSNGNDQTSTPRRIETP